MKNSDIQNAFLDLSTPIIADACMRLNISLRIAAPTIQNLLPGAKAAGRVLPVRHYGSVDIFLEAMHSAVSGDILVIDNEQRLDEGCIGDLTVLEAQAYGISAIIVWGVHRDSREIVQIGFPVFSYGQYPAGPQRLDQRAADALVSARFGDCAVTREDVAFADDDGVIFVPHESVEKLLETARNIKDTERCQAEAIANGSTLHKQLQFDSYLKKRTANPSYSFRKHLREIGGEIEE